MKKLIAFATSPWPLLLAMALNVVVFTLATIDWLYLPDNAPPLSEQDPSPPPEAEKIRL